ncbi:MAG: PIN domain-containing protein [Tannerella sp.]|jgi:predicted nucleic acid-binding protein|nr:PIN domain-containing protein [Tannerella sp.]
MTEKILIDTNIFIYAYTGDDERKHAISRDLLRNNVLRNEIIVSVQILNEFYVVMTKYKYAHNEIKLCMNEIIEQVKVTPLELETVKQCIAVREKYRYSWWDSLVLASALENDCAIVYSEDMQSGQIIENKLRIINPFTESPEE